MYIAPRPLSKAVLEASELRRDKTEARRYDDCGLGKKALYLGAMGISCVRYIPLTQIERVYKRLAVSKGFFEQGKVYGTLCYLVIRYDGKEKAVRFTHEEDVNLILHQFVDETDIPVGKP